MEESSTPRFHNHARTPRSPAFQPAGHGLLGGAGPLLQAPRAMPKVQSSGAGPGGTVQRRQHKGEGRGRRDTQGMLRRHNATLSGPSPTANWIRQEGSSSSGGTCPVRLTILGAGTKRQEEEGKRGGGGGRRWSARRSRGRREDGQDQAPLKGFRAARGGGG